MSDIIISVDGDTRPLEAKLGKISARTVNLNLKDSLSQPLGRITGKVSEFQKSLEASNARVLAFGASAGAIYTVQKAFSEIVKSTIEVEKSLADINVVLNASTKDLGKFGSSLFGIAKSTGQSFDQVSKAATEFARQGLGVAETLKRTSDALILSRLSGLDAARSVETLTAAVNTFSRAGVTSTQIINKLANVDASFAVSTGDLAEAISRVGSTAQDVGVDLDQLIALVTSAQQTTARGGAVIGNSFKTIFTRIQRADTLDALEGVGIAVRDLQGNVLPAMQVLDNLAKTFGKLTQAQQASIAEDVGGVFQINILRAALADLGKEYNVYNSALGVSRTATDQAIKRNEALNQTLSALTNKTFVNLKEAAAKVGEITIAPTIKGGLGGLNVLLEEFNKPQESQGIGTKIATGILSGIGNYLSGPGLAVVGMAFIKIFGGLTKFSAEALKSLLGIASSADRIAVAQERVNTILAQNPSLIQAIISKESSLLQIENQILKIIQQQNTARAVGSTISARVAPAAAAMPIPTVRTKTKAGGYIPNFSASAAQEIMGAYAGGYTPGAVKKTNGMYYNTAESVVQFPGASGPAIIPPEGSKAGKNYKKQFERSAGFDPYASNGFIPNFAKKERTKYEVVGGDEGINRYVAMIYPGKGQGQKVYTGEATYGDKKAYISFLGSGYNTKKTVKPDDADLEKQLGNNLVRFTNKFVSKVFGNQQPQARIKSVNDLANRGSFDSIVGAVFETAVGYATGNLNEGRSQNAPIDFANPNQKLKELFNFSAGDRYQFEAKGNPGSGNVNSVAQKILDLGLISGDLKGKLAGKLGPGYKEEVEAKRKKDEASYLRRKSEQGALSSTTSSAYNQIFPWIKGETSERGRFRTLFGSRRNKSLGYIPNFSALQDAISREQAAGISSSQIRVGSDSSLMNKSNPFGLGVYNTKDEPAGLKQGINRSRGNIPNFANRGAPTKEMEQLGNATKSSTDKMVEMQAKLNALSIGLSVAQGMVTQFGSETNKATQALGQGLGIISTIASGYGTGGKKYGGAIAGGMLAVQGVAGLSASANKPYTTEIDKLDKSLDVMRTKSGQLESTMSSLIPTINEYVAELDKSEPDPGKIAEFKKAILEGIAPLGKEMQDKIMKNLSSPKEVQAALSKEQRGGAIEQSQKELTKDIYQKQLNARQQMGFQGQVGQILSAVPGLGGAGKWMMEGQGPVNTLGTKQDMEGIASNLLAPLSQTPQDLALLASSLSNVSGNTNDVIAVLKMMAQSAGTSTEAIDAVNRALAESPGQANEFAQALFGSLKTITTRAKSLAEQGAGEGGISRNYKGAGKILTKESVQGQGNEPSLKAQMAEQTAIYARAQKIGPAAGIFQDTSSSTMVDLLTKSGIGLDTIKQTNPKLYESLNQGYQNKLKENMAVQEEAIRSSGGDVEAFKKIMGEKYKDPREFADAAIQENYGDQAPDLKNMGQTFIAQTAAQAANTEAVKTLTEAIKQANAGKENAKNATFDADQASRMGTKMPGAEPDWMNTLLTTLGVGGGVVSSALGGALGAGVANVSTKAVGGALNVGKNALPALGRAAPLLGQGTAIAAAGYGGYEAGNYLATQTEIGQSLTEKASNFLAPMFGGKSQEEQAQEEANAQRQIEEIKNRKKQKRSNEYQDDRATTSTQANKEASTETTNNISVAPNINIAQAAANDKADLQKMIEAEVKKFGEGLLKIVEEKSRNSAKGTVTPPQSMRAQMAA
jgi:TP901 family phage tail tape measure protein